MLFTTANFLVFLAVVVLIYGLFPQKYRWFVLLVGSMVFYGFAGPHFLAYICSTIIVTYFCTMRIDHLRKKRDALVAATADRDQKRELRAKFKQQTKKWTVLCLVIILGILAAVKYTDFVIANANSLFETFGLQARIGFMRFALPMGISFYTFQTVGYVVDVQREKATITRNPFKLALFVSFFPQVIQGPISRFTELSQELYNGAPIQWGSFSRGSQRIMWGFFKKLVVADRLWPALTVLTAAPDNFRGAYYLLSITLYAIILYMDFSGGIDITIGVAEIFGIRLPENFKRPYYARNIQEFWQRWHITMYSWFRDYVFYPMSVGKGMLRLSKWARRVFGDEVGKRLPIHVSLLWVWFITGLWHDASWGFITWGVAFGIVIMISLELNPLYNRFHARFTWAQGNRAFRYFQILRTFLILNVIRSFVIYGSVFTSLRMMGSVFTSFGAADFITRGVSELSLYTADYIAAGAGLLVVFWVSWLERGGTDFRDKMAAFRWPLRYAAIGLILFMIIILGAYGMGYDAHQFIYNQF